MTRREFLHGSAALPLLLGGKTSAPVLDTNRLTKFVERLPVPTVARARHSRMLPSGSAAPLYRIDMREIHQRVHPELPPTTLWAYSNSSPGPIIEARRGQPVFVEWRNLLPNRHFLPVDPSLLEPGKGDVRTVVHLHGGRVPPTSDGFPENTYGPGEGTVSFYPNDQPGTMLWYHDHAMGLTRLNILAGLFGAYFLRDETEAAFPLPNGEYEVPLLLCDRSFQEDGQLFYPVSDNPRKPWVPEFFGTAILANGKLFPFLVTEPRKYRFRLLNASNGRFLYLRLSNEQAFWQIGSDQGFLQSPVTLHTLTLAPGERADVVIDFAAHRGKSITLMSDTHSICQFRVSQTGSADASTVPKQLQATPRVPESQAVRTRQLTLTGGGDSDDPTTMSMPMLLNGARWHDPVTENPVLNSIEIWSLINLTDDTHPIHLHLVRFQILDRRSFDVFTYLNRRELQYTGEPIAPAANEAGWKDTVRADPGTVTRIIIHFEGFVGRYVWHCHVLEHEDYDMMRPYDVIALGGK